MAITSISGLQTLLSTITNANTQGKITPALLGGFLQNLWDLLTKKQTVVASESNTIDIANGRVSTLVLDENVTNLTLVPLAMPAGTAMQFVLQIKQDGGGFAITNYIATGWTVLFPGDTNPELSAADGAVTILAGIIDKDDLTIRVMSTSGYSG